MPHLDSNLLRSFLAIAETGSITDGAARIHRTQSAASLQIKRLETIVGGRVFDRHGRGVALTDLGQRLLPVARDVTTRLDTTLRRLTSDGLEGRLRLGVPDDHSQQFLSRIIADFTQSHPRVELEVTCDLSAHFPDALARGTLDLAVYEAERPSDTGTSTGTSTGANTGDVLMRDQTAWVMARGADLLACDPIPVALFDRACWWRDAALAALDNMGRPYRVVYSSQSVSGVSAAIEAGVAVGLLGLATLPSTLMRLGPDQGFPDMPISHLVLGKTKQAASAACTSMEMAIRKAFVSIA